jgi:hypothetical protein
MRGHALPSSCPRCREPSLPSPDQRLIECRKCGLGYDWLRQADGQVESVGRRGTPPTLDPPPGLVTRLRGRELELLLPQTRLKGFAMFVAMLASAAAAVAMFLVENTAFAIVLILITLMFAAMGATYSFTRRRITVTRTELRVDQVPFGSTPQVILLSELTQLALARTRRGSKQLLYDIELWAQAERGDQCLLVNLDENLGRYLEQRIEYQLAIADDGIEMVIPGAE